jgi:hypothetical protein
MTDTPDEAPVDVPLADRSALALADLPALAFVVQAANHDKRDELPLGPNGEGEPDLDTLWCWYETLIDSARAVLDAPPAAINPVATYASHPECLRCRERNDATADAWRAEREVADALTAALSAQQGEGSR